MFKTVLRALRTFGFVGLKIVFWVLLVELGGLLTPSVNRLSLASSRLVETLLTAASLCAQVTYSSTSILPSSSILGLCTSGYPAVLRITRDFLIP